MSSDHSTLKTINVPDTYVIIFFVALFAFALTYLVTPGQYDTQTIHYQDAGQEKNRTVLVADSFRYADDSQQGVPIFASGGHTGFINFVFEGLTSGDQWGSAVGVVAFILVVGGAFGLILQTGAIESGILALINKTRGYDILFIPIIFILFSLGGAVYGMGEECIALAMVVTPIVIALGYNALTGVMITYMASQIGFATSWMNPFSVAVAQGIAGVPVLSGAGFRMVMWASFVTLGCLYTMIYATRIRKHPERSLSLAADHYFHHQGDNQPQKNPFGFGHSLVILSFIAGVIWVVMGVMNEGYYIPEIASIFFAMGLAAAIIGIIFNLNGMTMNSAAAAFQQGVKDLAPAAMVVGLAKGIVLLLGGDDAAQPSVLNTLLHQASEILGHLSDYLAAIVMYLFQSVFNFFVTSGSGQAALTMPLMAPLGDLLGISRQATVVCFQLGDGLTNILVPTSGALIGTLGVCRVDWALWIRHIWPLALMLMALGLVYVVMGVVIFPAAG